MRHAARRAGWQPGVFDLFEQDFPKQLAHWGEHLLNARSRVCRFGEVRLDGATFLRPVQDTKSFAGRVFSPAEFEPWQRAVCARGDDGGSTLRADTLVQLSPPQLIHAEYRCWVVQGRVVTHSLYKRRAQVFSSPEVARHIDAFAEARTREWAPHEAFVMDVCETPDGLRIVEVNTLNSAGFYAADVQRLVMALDDAFSR
ncbi:MAG: ATP-grasp domain-containing protein [Myxococcota bacterium]